MTSATLAGKSIVVTRPEAQAEPLCAAIAARGGHAIRFPVLAIAPASDLGSVADACERLQDFDLAFFVSANAVHFTLDYILSRRAWPAHVRVATVGKGSEGALRARGFTQVLSPSSGFDSEAVLALAEFSEPAVRGREVVIFRGDGGRELLGQVLSARGARLTYVTTYRRYCPAEDASMLVERARGKGSDALVLTSSEGVRNLLAMAGPDGLAVIARIPVFAPHQRVAAVAREGGFVRVIETAPGDEGIIAALETHFCARPGSVAGSRG